MATYRRALVPGGTYFFTVVTNDRRPLLTTPACLSSLRRAFREVRSVHAFSIDAIVLLPDHLHCVWTLPGGDADYARRWSMIKRLTSRSVRLLLPEADNCSRRARRELSLWQRRYWEHLIRDEDDLDRHIDYIHWNPVKHALAARAAEWRYSSVVSNK